MVIVGIDLIISSLYCNNLDERSQFTENHTALVLTHNLLWARVRALAAIGTVFLVDWGPGRRDYFGRIMCPCHWVTTGLLREDDADKRNENIPLKIMMVSSWGSGKTMLHQTHCSTQWVEGASVTMVPSPGSPFHVCQEDCGGRKTRDVVGLAGCRRCVHLCVCSLHVCAPSGPGRCTLTEARHTTWII